MHFHPWITPILPTHIKIIPKSSWNLFSIPFLFQFLSSFKTFPLISPNIILIWVTTHIHTKYQDLLGFDQNPNSISFYLTMNPTTKEGFHNYLVLCGYTNLNFKKSKVRIQFYQNPRFRDKRLTISSLKFHVIHTKSILKVVSIP